MINSFIISRLIEADYEIYLPIDGDKTFIIINKETRELERCIALNASKDGESSPFIKVDKINSIIACVDKQTRTVWLLPFGCYRPAKILRLGKNYERYIIPEPNSLSYQEQKQMRKSVSFNLLQKAKDAVERMHKGVNLDD